MPIQSRSKGTHPRVGTERIACSVGSRKDSIPTLNPTTVPRATAMADPTVKPATTRQVLAAMWPHSSPLRASR